MPRSEESMMGVFQKIAKHGQLFLLLTLIKKRQKKSL